MIAPTRVSWVVAVSLTVCRCTQDLLLELPCVEEVMEFTKWSVSHMQQETGQFSGFLNKIQLCVSLVLALIPKESFFIAHWAR